MLFVRRIVLCDCVCAVCLNFVSIFFFISIFGIKLQIGGWMERQTVYHVLHFQLNRKLS